MTLGDKPNSDQRLCSLTTGAMGRFKGVTEMADLHWWVFDYLLKPELSYWARYGLLALKVKELNHPRIHLMPYMKCFTRKELDTAISGFAQMNYEGTIIRNPEAA